MRRTSARTRLGRTRCMMSTLLLVCCLCLPCGRIPGIRPGFFKIHNIRGVTATEDPRCARRSVTRTSLRRDTVAFRAVQQSTCRKTAHTSSRRERRPVLTLHSTRICSTRRIFRTDSCSSWRCSSGWGVEGSATNWSSSFASGTKSGKTLRWWRLTWKVAVRRDPTGRQAYLRVF